MFNLIVTLPLQDGPEANQKILQLNSPFSEYVFQKFSRFFYSVGFNDENIKTAEYYDKWAGKMETRK